ncbi:MAG TPA: PRC-barrel domain-containing protein [Gemmatimonadaceae bacterium]|nr:PRC-barrel domain-containing protein [Gemmatimonadaceae bacterium]
MDHNDRIDRGSRDAAGVGPYARERDGLVPLSSLSSWSVSEGEPDVRGWEVRTVSGRHLGSVKDLLIDAQAGEVVMLDVDLAGSDQHSLVPIRVAQIDRGRRVILMDSADMTDVTVRGPAGARPVDASDAKAQRSVSYPDREVVVERTRLVDDVAPPADYSASTQSDRSEPRDSARDAHDAAIDRRRAERRKIDRMSTDF